ncbi:NAD(P)H-hydrate dehydratase [Glaciecola sp. MH2013]|uniref:NAD(P)H-hydrate dehydratase n=1 Tax=Glaciecola sp. MH2013 TaxID=2785524 RepID=UPI00189D0134|nr:NAD(P)H-hydrate dehydratase [Glaciecola sp. MH2013]MBF7074116.1 NAD(P)H-hydrate dehydratase [Glaciecola sp. MH2013]
MLHKNTTPSLTQKLYRAAQVKHLELEAAAKVGITKFELMQRAGKAVFERCISLMPNTDTYLILVGVGNNAGDGYITALNAVNAGKNVILCAIEPEREVTGDVARAQKAWLDNGGKVEAFDAAMLERCDLVIDALLGIGIVGLIRNEFADVIDSINSSGIPVVSIDLPSGLDADTGESLGRCIQADITITFIGIKLGLTTGAGKQSCGKLIFEDLGIGKAFSDIARSDANALDIAHFKGLAPRPVHSHKGSYGRLLCIGGNAGMAGAIRLSAEAALRSGTGLVKVYAHEGSKIQISAGRPELMVTSSGLKAALEWATCIVIGPGLGQDQWSKDTFNEVLAYCQENPKPMVIDADALNVMASTASFVTIDDCVITPHSGEAARLLSVSVEEVENNRFVFARQCAERYHATCVLKGAGTIIDDEQDSWVCRHGNPGMATAGMGDVLTGIIGSLMAQGVATNLACQYGVSLHAKAGDLVAEEKGQRGLLASDLFDTVRYLINE